MSLPMADARSLARALYDKQLNDAGWQTREDHVADSETRFLANQIKLHSSYKDADFVAMDPAIFARCYPAMMAEVERKIAAEGRQIPIPMRDDAGHKIVKTIGDNAATWAPFLGARVKRVRITPTVHLNGRVYLETDPTLDRRAR